MPRTYLMTWVPARRGWMKWHRGKNYSVSCRQLGVEPTKEASYQAANAWWQARESELETRSRPTATPLDPASATIRDIAGRYSIGDLRRLEQQGDAARKVLEILDRASVEGAVPPPGAAATPSSATALARLEAGEGIPAHVISLVLSQGFSGEMAPEYREQRLRRLVEEIGPEPAPPERTVGGQVEAWVRLQRSRHVAGKISASRVDAYERNVAVFRDWIRPGTDIAEVTAPRLRDYHGWLCAQIGSGRFSAAYARSLFGAARNFISRMAELDLIPLPGNIRSRDFTFDDTPKAIPRFTNDEVRRLLEGCDGYSERTRLFLLLMLNCGMYQSDISDLKPSEVDWERGVITRRRSKRRKGGLVVTYQLWPETLELLARFGNRHGERVLLSDDGNPLVKYTAADGDLDRYDLIAQAYRNLRKRVGIDKPLKVFRKTSADILEKHKDYGRFYPFFLAHSPKSLGEKHYVTPSEEIFFEALAWLRSQVITQIQPADRGDSADL
ncbi:tyrosine-type recombinase/integrase [Tautonia plasticadhaerens]|uniref:Phage integrase family protein n=1 Tax=Tautonia plasticadhaerens TaxID=2527974 RepID=A0A518H813_9BACT|nr:tyrosine-type recombinase/integrase [Tautonia plasticadhaerens]QDV36983.1 Phage integrase family protein [Tautonia plasticadhaerens]